MMRKFLILSVVAIAVFASGACSDDDTIVGPQPTLTPTPRAIDTEQDLSTWKLANHLLTSRISIIA